MFSKLVILFLTMVKQQQLRLLAQLLLLRPTAYNNELSLSLEICCNRYKLYYYIILYYYTTIA